MENLRQSWYQSVPEDHQARVRKHSGVRRQFTGDPFPTSPARSSAPRLKHTNLHKHVLHQSEYCWVICFNNENYWHQPEVSAQFKETRKEITKRLLRAGLAVKKRKSVDEQKFFLFVGCPQLYLEYIATKMELPVAFLMQEERRDEDGSVVVETHKGYKPFDIFRKEDHVGLTDPEGNFRFRSKGRIQMIHAIMQEPWDPQRHKFGAGLNIRKLIENEPAVRDIYILHDYSASATLATLRKEWARADLMYTWKQPFNQIRDYFGEEIAMYFRFVGYYTNSLRVPASLGVVTSVIVFLTRNTSYDTVATTTQSIFSCVLGLWACVFLQDWRQKEATLAYRWGMQSLKYTEATLPDFVGDYDPVLDTLVYDREKDKNRTMRLLGSAIVVTLSVVLVMTTMTFYATLVAYLQRKYGMGIVGSALNAMSIAVLNSIHAKIARYLTAAENHRTNSEFQNQLIIKRFVFQFINSYFTLYLTAFVKPLGRVGQMDGNLRPMDDKTNFAGKWFGTCRCASFTPSGCELKYDCNGYDCRAPEELCHCHHRDCNADVGLLLFVIFLVQVILGNFVEVVVPYIAHKLHKKAQKAGPEISSAEKELILPEYQAVFDDYNELILQFGFVTLFGCNFPMVGVLAFMNDLFEIRSDAMKICYVMRRPLPMQTADIGAWYLVMEVMSFAAVTTNCASIFCFTRLLQGYDMSTRVIAMFIAEHVAILLKVSYMMITPSVTEELQKDIDRTHAMGVRTRLEDLAEKMEHDQEMVARIEEYCNPEVEPSNDAVETPADFNLEATSGAFNFNFGSDQDVASPLIMSLEASLQMDRLRTSEQVLDLVSPSDTDYRRGLNSIREDAGRSPREGTYQTEHDLDVTLPPELWRTASAGLDDHHDDADTVSKDRPESPEQHIIKKWLRRSGLMPKRMAQRTSRETAQAAAETEMEPLIADIASHVVADATPSYGSLSLHVASPGAPE